MSSAELEAHARYVEGLVDRYVLLLNGEPWHSFLLEAMNRLAGSKDEFMWIWRDRANDSRGHLESLLGLGIREACPDREIRRELYEKAGLIKAQMVA